MKRSNTNTSGTNGRAPELKKIRPGTPYPTTRVITPRAMEVNYFAYEVQPRMAKTLHTLITAEKIVANARVVIDHGVAGILMSFTDWRQVARFFHWSHRGEQTRQLMKVIRVTCGPISANSLPYYDANDILHKRAIDEIPTETVPESGPYSDGTIRRNFLDFLIRGVECSNCKRDHVPPRSTL